MRLLAVTSWAGGPCHGSGHGQLARRHQRLTVLLVSAALGSGLVGCAQPCRMRLAGSPHGNDRAFHWWLAAPASGPRSPIIGVEWSPDPAMTDQWLLSRHGVRRFRYRGARVVAAGPPTPTVPTPEGLDQVRRWLLRGAPPPVRKPTPKVAAGLNSMADVVTWAESQWPDERIEPPAGLSSHAIGAEMEAFPHGLAQLLELAGQF